MSAFVPRGHCREPFSLGPSFPWLRGRGRLIDERPSVGSGGVSERGAAGPPGSRGRAPRDFRQRWAVLTWPWVSRRSWERQVHTAKGHAHLGNAIVEPDRLQIREAVEMRMGLEATAVEGDRHVVCKNPENITGGQRARLSVLEQFDRPLYRADLLEATTNGVRLLTRPPPSSSSSSAASEDPCRFAPRAAPSDPKQCQETRLSHRGRRLGDRERLTFSCVREPGLALLDDGRESLAVVVAGDELGLELAAPLQGAARGGASPRPHASRRRQAPQRVAVEAYAVVQIFRCHLRPRGWTEISPFRRLRNAWSGTPRAIDPEASGTTFTRRGLRRSGGSTCGTQRPSASRPSLAVRRGPHGDDRWGETRAVGLGKRQVARRSKTGERAGMEVPRGGL